MKKRGGGGGGGACAACTCMDPARVSCIIGISARALATAEKVTPGEAS